MRPGLTPLHRIHARPGSEPLRGPVWTRGAGGPVYPALARCRTLVTSPGWCGNPGRPCEGRPGPSAREGPRALVGRRSGIRARFELLQEGAPQLGRPRRKDRLGCENLTPAERRHICSQRRGRETRALTEVALNEPCERGGTRSVRETHGQRAQPIPPGEPSAIARPVKGRGPVGPMRDVRSLSRDHRNARRAQCEPYRRGAGLGGQARGVVHAAASSRSGRPMRSGQTASSGQLAESQRTAASYRRTWMSFPSWRAASFFESPNTRQETVTRSQPVTRSYSAVRARS